MALWFGKILARCLFAPRSIFASASADEGTGHAEKDLVVIHGDTLSALLGAVMGRVARLEVAHIEAGLSSFNLWNPFPEELTRRLCFRLSHVLYCPGSWAAGNVARLGRVVVDTEANTLCDTLALALQREQRRDHVPLVPYAIASLHRFENIFRRRRLEELLEILEELAEHYRVLFILHPPTDRQLRQLGLMQRLEANRNIELRPRYTYFDFVALLQQAEFVATDGGSVQEESNYLGVPCLILREGTERREGIGANALLSRLDRDLIRDFASDPARFRRPPLAGRLRPSECIVDSLTERQRLGTRAGGRTASGTQ
jgi:UDP-N-acetylglucosamine 2-epimerase (non-hydrolysing)